MQHDERWVEYFAKHGYPQAKPLGSGMEGTVYKLGENFVGKVWVRREATELRRLQEFYADLSETPLPFATPLIHEVQTFDGLAITIERELHGVPLQNYISENSSIPQSEAVDCILEVLRGLRSVEGTARMRELAVLDEPRSLWADCKDWSEALIGLMARRVARFGSQLRARVPRFNMLYKRVIEELATLRPERLTAIHGDLCGANILVDDACAPTAVLDFGFLSSAGDPAFDVSVAAAIYNMYGPHARKLDDALTTQLASEFGYPLDILLLYRAVYAIISSNAYDAAGQDGHFAWCAAILNRDDIAAMYG